MRKIEEQKQALDEIEKRLVKASRTRVKIGENYYKLRLRRIIVLTNVDTSSGISPEVAVNSGPLLLMGCPLCSISQSCEDCSANGMCNALQDIKNMYISGNITWRKLSERYKKDINKCRRILKGKHSEGR